MTRSRRKFKFSKAFVGRIVAVGLFVCLGTFAVVQSINQVNKKSADAKKVDSDHDHDDHQEPDPNSSAGALDDPHSGSSDEVSQISAKPASFNQESIGTEDQQGSTNAIPRVDSLPTANSLPIQTDQFPGLPENDSKESNQYPPLINGNPDSNGISSDNNQTTSDQGQFGSLGDDSQFGTPGVQQAPKQSDNANSGPQTEDQQLPNQFPQSGNQSTIPSQSNPPYDPFGRTQNQDSIGNPASKLPDPTTLPNNTLPNNTLPNNTLPNNTLPNNTLPNNTLPNNTLPNNTLPNNTLPNNTLPNNTLPNNTLPNNTLPNNTLPNQFPTQSGQPASIDQTVDDFPGQRPITQNSNRSFNNGSATSQDVVDGQAGSSGFPANRSSSHIPQNEMRNQDGLPSNLLPQSKNDPPEDPNASRSFQNGGNFADSDLTSRQPDSASGQRPIQGHSKMSAVGDFPLADRLPSIPVSTIREVEGIQAPSLTLQKIAPREITVNQIADLELVVRNTGKTTAENVTVHDKVASNIQVIQFSPEPISNQAGNVSWNLGSIAPGGIKRIKIKIKPMVPGEIGSVAQVTFTSRAGARTKITKPQLRLFHSAQAKTLIGRFVVMQITIENTGDGPATNVVIQEKIPANFKYMIGNREEKEIEYSVGTLRPGQKRTINLRMKASQVGRIQNQLVAEADGGLRAQHQIDLEIVAPNLGVEAAGPKRRFLGRPAEHQFTIKNTGTAAATNVELSAKLPRGLRFSSANHHGQYHPATHSVVWSLDSLGPGVMGKVKLTTVPLQNGNQTIEFVSTADLGQQESTQTNMLVYQVAELYFDIKDETDALEIGAETVYNVRVVNRGAKVANNVRLSIQFADGLKPVQIDGASPTSALGQIVTLPVIAKLGPKQQRQFKIRARGVTPGEHRVIASLASDDRELAVKKEESTHVYSDQ